MGGITIFARVYLYFEGNIGARWVVSSNIQRNLETVG